MKDAQRFEFATQYTAAWCSQDAASVVSFFAANSSLSIKENAPAVGRNAITQVAQSFMTAFPDLRVVMGKILSLDNRDEYHWTLTGTNDGPSGKGCRNRISRYELWRFDADGLISSSKGHFNASEYKRQLEEGARGL